MKKLFIIVFILLSFNFALAFQVSPNSMYDEIEKYKLLSKKITIINSNETQHFKVYFDCDNEDICNWLSFVDNDEAVSELSFKLNPNKTTSIYIQGIVPKELDHKEYNLDIIVKGEEKTVSIPYQLRYWEKYDIFEKALIYVNDLLETKYVFPNPNVPTLYVKHLVIFISAITVLAVLIKVII